MKIIVKNGEVHVKDFFDKSGVEIFSDGEIAFYEDSICVSEDTLLKEAIAFADVDELLEN